MLNAASPSSRNRRRCFQRWAGARPRPANFYCQSQTADYPPRRPAARCPMSPLIRLRRALEHGFRKPSRQPAATATTWSSPSHRAHAVRREINHRTCGESPFESAIVKPARGSSRALRPRPKSPSPTVMLPARGVASRTARVVDRQRWKPCRRRAALAGRSPLPTTQTVHACRRPAAEAEPGGPTPISVRRENHEARKARRGPRHHARHSPTASGLQPQASRKLDFEANRLILNARIGTGQLPTEPKG